MVRNQGASHCGKVCAATSQRILSHERLYRSGYRGCTRKQPWLGVTYASQRTIGKRLWVLGTIDTFSLF